MACSILISVLLFIVSVMISSGRAILQSQTPYILPLPRPSPVKEGTGIKLTCGVDRAWGGDSADKEVYWLRVVGNQVERIVNKYPPGRVYITTLDNDGGVYAKILNIDNIIKADETEYRCVVEWGPTRHWYPVFLNVISNPAIAQRKESWFVQTHRFKPRLEGNIYKSNSETITDYYEKMQHGPAYVSK